MNRKVCIVTTVAALAFSSVVLAEEVPTPPMPDDEAQVPNVPVELSAPPDVASATDAKSTSGSAADAAVRASAEPIRLSPPAQRAISESRAWAENPAAMPVRDAGGRVVFAFSESAPTIVCAPLHVCEIQLQSGERIEGEPHIGDAIRWKVAPAMSGSDAERVVHLIVKPTEAGLDTNLIIPTDRRTYHLRLVSSRSQYVSSVAFDYPDEQQQSWKAFANAAAGGSSSGTANGGDLPVVAVNRLNFNYKIKVVKGKPDFRPLRAMDDGYHTYVAMNEELPAGAAPALIGIAPNGAEQMINYRLKGNLYVVDGTVTKLALISGVGRDQERIELTRESCKRRGWLGICWDAKE